MNKKAFFAVMISALLAGASGIFIKSVTMSATSIAFVRTIIPTFLLGGYLLLTGTKLFRGNYKLMLGGSVFNAIRMYFFFVAYIYTSIGNAVIIAFTWPIFVTIFSAIFLKEIVSSRKVILLGVSFIGILIAFSNQAFTFENRDFIGMTAALALAITYAASVIIFKKGTREFGSGEIIFYQNVVGVFVFLPFFLQAPFPSFHDLSIISSYAILMGIIGFLFFFYGLKHLPASTASMIAYVEIVSAFCLGIFLLGESFSWNMLFGGGIIIITTMLLRKN